MFLSNHSFFQYCGSNIGLFSIAPCKVIILNPFCILFGISSLLLFWWLSLQSYRSSNFRDIASCRSFSLLKAIAKRLPLLFANDFKSDNYSESNTEKKPWTNLQYLYKNLSKEIKIDNFCYRKVGKAITKWGAIEKGLILLSQYWKNYHF